MNTPYVCLFGYFLGWYIPLFTTIKVITSKNKFIFLKYIFYSITVTGNKNLNFDKKTIFDQENVTWGALLGFELKAKKMVIPVFNYIKFVYGTQPNLIF